MELGIGFCKLSITSLGLPRKRQEVSIQFGESNVSMN